MEGGLGVIKLSNHNDALLMKFIHKFYSKADIPWVHLVWNNYYSNNRLPGQQNKGSFWWRDIVKLIPSFKQFSPAKALDGSSILFWLDNWNDHIHQNDFPELFSFAKNPTITVKALLHSTPLISNFHLPFSSEAYHQFLNLESRLNDIHILPEPDLWSFS
jgi:hypothetical protein